MAARISIPRSVASVFRNAPSSATRGWSTPAIPAGQLEQVQAGQRAFRRTTPDGVDYLWAWDRVEPTPWIAMIGTPSGAVFDPIYSSAFQRGLLNLLLNGGPLLL